jgi:hypothetical protein
MLPFIASRRPDGSAVTWTGPLACFLLAAGTITAEQWRAYLTDGDAASLPEAPATITVRALGAGRESAECEAEAGPPEELGAFLLRRVHEALPHGSEALRTEASVRAIDGLPEADRAAVHRYQMRAQRVQRARLNRGIVAIDGDTLVDVDGFGLVSPLEALDMLPADLHLLALVEAERHMARVGSLGTAGK